MVRDVLTAESPEDTQSAPALWLIVSLAALGPFSISVYLPALPSLTEALGASPAQGQLTMTLYLAGFAIAQLVYGPLSDRLGRRPMMIAGLLIYVVASIAAALATTIALLLAARFVQALGACAGTVLSRAVVRDSTSGPEIARTMAVIAAALALSPALGPAVGGIVDVWFDWRACFLLLAGFGALLLLCVLFQLGETNRHPTPDRLDGSTIARGYLALVRDSNFLGFVLSGAFISAAAYVYNIGAPFIFITLLGLAPDTYGLLGLVTGAGYFGGTMLVRRRAGSVRAEQLALVGSRWALVGAVVLLEIALIGPLRVWSIIASMTIFAVGLGLLLPTTAAAALARYPRSAGAAAAVIGCSQMGIGVAATALLSALDRNTPLPMAGLIAALALLTSASCWFTAHRSSGASLP